MTTAKKPAVKKPAAKKPVVKKVQPAKKVVKPVTKPAAEGPSKMELAVEIYKKLIAEKKARKDVILAFIADAGLTKAGASTYFGLIKAKVNAGKL